MIYKDFQDKKLSQLGFGTMRLPLKDDGSIDEPQVFEMTDWAMEQGVSDGTNPTAPITREQLATMLWRYAGRPESEGSLAAFTDGASVSTWAAEAMEWAVSEGIFQGDGRGILNPGGNATRAQIAQVILNYLTK